jgi:ribosome-associated heat shock protein Hsp15
MSDTATHPGAARLDRWLFAVRLMASRALATAAVSGGRVHVNGVRVKPSHALRPGDRVSLTRGALAFECTALAIPERRGPAAAARLCYEESPASVALREAFGARMKVAGARAPRPEGRPDKHARRHLQRLKGRI